MSNEAQLAEELARARRAKQAYDIYVKDHIDTTVKKIYEGIESCSVVDTQLLCELKSLLSAVRGLERSILNDIDTGVLAEKMLEDVK